MATGGSTTVWTDAAWWVIVGLDVHCLCMTKGGMVYCDNSICGRFLTWHSSKILSLKSFIFDLKQNFTIFQTGPVLSENLASLIPETASSMSSSWGNSGPLQVLVSAIDMLRLYSNIMDPYREITFFLFRLCYVICQICSSVNVHLGSETLYWSLV